jgi:parallel beta-helix repeat protein
VANRVIACYVDGRFVRLARYPNVDVGFLRIDNDDEHDRIVDGDLALRPGVASGRWTGAQVRWRKWSWWWETRPISSHGPVDTLDLSAEGRVDILISDPGSGYFIDHDLDELDAPGEWHWQGGVLYLFPPSWADPSIMKVQVVTTTSTDALVDHEDEPSGVISSGTSFDNVHFSRFYGNALRLNGPATVVNCTFSEVESVAVRYTWNAQPFVIRQSVFRDVRNIAIQGWADAAGPAGSLIERNLFHRIGADPGYGGNGPWHAAGVIVGQANAAVVRLNRFVDTGYAGIILGSDGQTVERNVFVRAMSTLNDGAAVYTNCNESYIRENIILDTMGDLEYSHPWWPLGHGIWLEFLEDFHDSEVTDNTIYGSNGHGIFLPNNFDCTISFNVAVDNRRAGLGLYMDSDPNQNHTIGNNTLAAVAPTRRVQRSENLNQWWLPPYAEPVPVALEYENPGDYGSMSHTSFIAASSGAAPIREEDSGNIFDTLSAWTTDAPAWADSTGSLVARANAILLFNDTETPANMVVPAGTWTLPDGTGVGTTAILQPFRSVVLITNDEVSGTPPYRGASGIDWRADTPTNHYLGAEIFADDFEFGNTTAWSRVIGN